MIKQDNDNNVALRSGRRNIPVRYAERFNDLPVIVMHSNNGATICLAQEVQKFLMNPPAHPRPLQVQNYIERIPPVVSRVTTHFYGQDPTHPTVECLIRGRSVITNSWKSEYLDNKDSKWITHMARSIGVAVRELLRVGHPLHKSMYDMFQDHGMSDDMILAAKKARMNTGYRIKFAQVFIEDEEIDVF